MNYIYLTLIVVFIVDLSGFDMTVIDFATRLTHRRVTDVKPLTCSLCMTWWSGLAMALIRHEFDLQHLALVALLAFLSFPISRLLIFISDGLIKIINIISKWTI